MKKKAKRALQEVHKGICTTHTNGHIMSKKNIKIWLFLDDNKKRLYRPC
jgi:hypothetical protein